MPDPSAVKFQSGELTLEGLLYTPDGAAPKSVVVACHPHPQYGGDMRNNVVGAIVRAAVEVGLSALAFNFRGVGGSQGSFDQGAGERDDVRAALAYARSLPGVAACMLAGYSFGAAMAAAAVDESVPALALVALPAAMAGHGHAALGSYRGRVLLLSGASDGISPEPAVRQIAASLPSSPRVIIVPGADHFWWGRESELVGVLRDFFGPTPAAGGSPAHQGR